MSQPPYAVTFRGLPACPCQVEWIPAFEAHCRRVIPGLQGTLAIAQMIGLYEGSGNTHGDPSGKGLRKGGGATDFWVTGALADLVVAQARQMGAPATWHRPRNWDGDDGSEHVHSVLEGCPHATVEALLQIAAVYADGDGLVGNIPDPGPRPVPHRTWREGIEWAEEQDMPSPKDWDADDWKAVQEKLAKPLVKAIWDASVTAASAKAVTARAALRKAAGL